MFLTIFRTSDDRCEQCDSTEHVLHFIGQEGEQDTIRLTACVVCVIVAMDNAMQWNMSRSFAQAIANRAAGEHVQQLAREEKAKFDARLRQAEERTRIPLSDPAETGKGSDLRPHSGTDARRGARPLQDDRGRHRDRRGTQQRPSSDK